MIMFLLGLIVGLGAMALFVLWLGSLCDERNES